MATHLKTPSFKSPFAARVFSGMNQTLLCINGRLKGFNPSPVGGSVETPGIVITGQKIFVSVTLSPLDTEDATLPSSPDSAAVANGVVLQTIGTVSVNFVYTSAGTPANDVASVDDPLHIYVLLDDNEDTTPTFAVAKLSEIDASPYQKAKLAYFDSTTSSWVRTESVSQKSVYEMAKAAVATRGGFAVTISDADVSAPAIQVGPGAITASKNRVVSLSSKLISYASILPTSLKYRRDLVVLIDPLTEDTSIIPQIQIIQGAQEYASLGDSGLATPPPPTSQLQIPLASILVTNPVSGDAILHVTDMRPDFAWQTDSMSASNPQAAAQMTVTAHQPGVVLKDTSLSDEVDWFFGEFQGVTANTDIFVVGKLGPVQSRLILISEASHTVTSSEWTPTPYVLKSSLKLYDATGGVPLELTPDQISYAFDFLNGVFTAPVVKAGYATPYVLKVDFQQVDALFAIENDGTVNIADLELLRNHLLASNSSAHTASNILYNNSTGTITGLPSTEVSLQSAVERVAQQAFIGGGGGGTTSTAGRLARVYTFGRNKFGSGVSPATEFGLGVGLSAGSNDTIEKVSDGAGPGPFYVNPRAAKIRSISLSMRTETPVPSLSSATVAQLTIYTNGGLALTSIPVTVTTESSRLVLSGYEDYATPSVAVAAGARLSCGIKFDVTVTPTVNSNYGILATIELLDD